MKTMANPAGLLHEQLSRWAAVTPQHRARKLDTDKGWVDQRRAVKNLEHLEEAIQELKAAGKPVNIEEQYFPHWTKAVFAYPHGWNKNEKYIQDTTLHFLLLASHRLDEIILPVADGAPQDMLWAADELEASVAERDDLPAALRLLIVESVGFLRNSVLKYEITGEFILNKAVKQFAQTLELLEETMPNNSILSNIKIRIRKWYKSSPAQMAVAGIISAQMALATPIMNDAAQDAVTSAVELFELSPGAEVEVRPETEPTRTSTNAIDDAEK